MFWDNIVSIDIGNKNIKIVEGKQQGNNIVVNKAITVRTPSQSYNDGQIIDKERLKSIIHGTLESCKIKTKKVICSIESTSIITRKIILPKVKEEEMESMVKYEVEQYLPIMLDDYVVEYKVLDTFRVEGVDKFRMLVATIPKIMVENFLELLKEINIKPVALDLNSNAISKIFNRELEINKEISNLEQTVAILDIGHKFINMDIISKGIIQFSRLVTSGGKDIDINIANHFNLSVEEAEEKKMNDCNIAGKEDTSAVKEMLNYAVTTSIENWVVEIKRVFQYYETRKLVNKIDRVYLHGGSSKLLGIESYMEKALEMPVKRINEIDKIKLSKSIDNFEIANYLNALGAIIRLGR